MVWFMKERKKKKPNDYSSPPFILIYSYLTMRGGAGDIGNIIWYQRTMPMPFCSSLSARRFLPTTRRFSQRTSSRASPTSFNYFILLHINTGSQSTHIRQISIVQPQSSLWKICNVFLSLEVEVRVRPRCYSYWNVDFETHWGDIAQREYSSRILAATEMSGIGTTFPRHLLCG